MQKSFTKKQKDFYHVWSHMNELYARWAEHHGVGSNTLMILYGLDIYGDMTQKMLSEHCGIPKQTVNNVIKSLQKDGYILLTSGTRDRREKLVSMTRAGKDYAASILKPLYELEQQTIDLVGEERVVQMLEVGNLFNTVFGMKMEETADEAV